MGNCNARLVKNTSQLVYLTNPTDFPIRVNLVNGQINNEKIESIDQVEVENEYTVMPYNDVKLECRINSHVIVTQDNKRCIIRLMWPDDVIIHLKEVEVELANAIVHTLDTERCQEMYFKFFTLTS